MEGKAGILGAAGIRRRERSDSCGRIDEMMKRKREEKGGGIGEEETSPFRRSKRTTRSPKEGEVGGKEVEGGLSKGWKEEMAGMMRDLREGLKEDNKKMREEIGEGMREQVRMLREEIEGVRRESEVREERWKREREELRNCIKGLENKMEKLAKEGISKGPERGKEVEEGGEGLRSKVGRIERNLERQEREERRKNIIIKRVEVRNGKRKEAVEEILEKIGVKVEIKEIKRIRGGMEDTEEMVLVKLEDQEQKREIMRKKGMLKGRKERILDDWTWKERKMRWSLEEIARGEERKGNKVGLGYGKIRINEQWWRWDEEEEVLRDGRGNKRHQEKGEDKGTGGGSNN